MTLLSIIDCLAERWGDALSTTPDRIPALRATVSCEDGIAMLEQGHTHWLVTVIITREGRCPLIAQGDGPDPEAAFEAARIDARATAPEAAA